MFLRPGRILLSGHSHQAWPDAARAAQGAYFDDAAELVDDKWGARVLPLLESVGKRILQRHGFAQDDAIAFGRSSHELGFRLLSCLDLVGFEQRRPPRIVTTDGEFHSLWRQLGRLAEAGVEVEVVPVEPRASLVNRLRLAMVDTAMVAISAVFFEDSYVVPGLGTLVDDAARWGALVLVDAYHAFNAVPLNLGPDSPAFVMAGGYKYAGFGEGLCWLRLPKGCDLRPLYTGWFADFGALSEQRSAAPKISYGADGARFAGATFDGSALYRAAAALDVWDRHGLDLATLRRISQTQTDRIIRAVQALGLPPDRLAVRSPIDPARRGAFVALRVPGAANVVAALRARGVFCDSRGDTLRLGPAPYLWPQEIDQGVAILGEILRLGGEWVGNGKEH